MKPLISIIIAAVAFAAIAGWSLYLTSIKICRFSDQPAQSGIQILTNAEASKFAVNEEASETVACGPPTQL